MFKVLKLRNIRIQEQKKLNENNRCLYKHITSYIKATDLTMYEKEEVLHQIMDMLLEAQYDNRDKSFIVGDDYKAFCKSIMDEYMVNKSKIYIVLDYIQRYIFIMMLALFVDGLYNLYKLGEFGFLLNDIIDWNMFTIIVLFLYRVVARESIKVPIYEKSKITVNTNFSQNPKYFKVFLVVFIISLFLQIFIKAIFKIDSYTFYISLGNIILVILPIIIVFLLGISLYKFYYIRSE